MKVQETTKVFNSYAEAFDNFRERLKKGEDVGIAKAFHGCKGNKWHVYAVVKK